MGDNKGNQGPSICTLCNAPKENIHHMLITCPFSMQLWRKVELIICVQTIWEGSIVDESMKIWFEKKELK
jgi:hypothetical protein